MATRSQALATDAITTSNVGAYAIARGSLAASPNYALTYTGASLTVTPRVLSVTADTLTGSTAMPIHAQLHGQGLMMADALVGALGNLLQLRSELLGRERCCDAARHYHYR